MVEGEQSPFSYEIMRELVRSELIHDGFILIESERAVFLIGGGTNEGIQLVYKFLKGKLETDI